MKRQVILVSILAAVLLAAGATWISADNGVIEQRLLLRYIKPSELMRRFSVLGGLATTGDFRVSFKPEDESRTLIVRVQPQAGETLQREQLQLVLEDAIERYDRPTAPIHVDFYVVRTGLLDERQFRDLDAALRKGPLDLKKGMNARGIVFRKAMDLSNLEIARVNESQDEVAAKTQPEPCHVEGALLARARRDGRIYLSAELAVTKGALSADGTNPPKAVRVVGGSMFPSDGVLVLAAGERLPLDEPMADAPLRYEVMVYVIARPTAPNSF